MAFQSLYRNVENKKEEKFIHFFLILPVCLAIYLGVQKEHQARQRHLQGLNTLLQILQDQAYLNLRMGRHINL